MNDIISRIDSVVPCIVCSRELPARRGSDDFCGDACYSRWAANRLDPGAVPVTATPPAVADYQPAWVTPPIAGDLAGYEPIPPADPPRASMLRDTSQLLVALAVFVVAQFGRRHK